MTLFDRCAIIPPCVFEARGIVKNRVNPPADGWATREEPELSIEADRVVKMFKYISFQYRALALVILLLSITVVLFCALTLCNAQTDYWQQFREPPEKGWVPNEATAIKVAEAVWLPVFGDEIYDYWPFTATLSEDSIWTVQGTLENISSNVLVAGGVPFVEIRKSDCKILILYHGE